jgi:hypothetical protein
LTPTAIRSTQCAPRSAYAELQLHVADRATDTALVGVRGDEVVERTWQELGLRVERAAAAFLRADFRRHHVVIMAMRPGPDAVEVELAVRAVGAVPLLVAPDVTGAELAPHLTGVRVRLVVSDDADAVTRLAGYDLSRVEHLVLGAGDNWERVQAVGAAHLVERPTCVRDAAATGPVTQAAVHVLREADQVVVRRLPAVAAVGLPAETTLLNGPAWDPRVTAVRATLLATGGALAWTDDPAHLPVLVRHANPQVLATFTAGHEFESLLRGAHVNGRRWHRSPAEVLSATVTLASGERVGSGVRRRARSIESLRPWFGPRLHTVVLDRRHDPVLAAVAQVLDLAVVAAPLELEAAALPLAPTRRPPPVKPLPHRKPGDPDVAFQLTLASAAPTDDPDLYEPVLPSLPLLVGDSMLDRLLASQADQRRRT